MTKLDGNGRWGTKMATPELLDAYDSPKEEAGGSNILSAAERNMIRDYVILPYIKTMVEKSLKELEASKNILKSAYAMGGHAIQERISQDLHNNQRQLKQLNIRVVLDAQDDESLRQYKVFYRGRQERIGFTRAVMRSEISRKITGYTAELEEFITKLTKK